MWDQQPVVFVLPEGSDLISGGNLYNSALIRALGDRFALQCISAEQWQSRASQAGLYVVDTLNLREFEQVVLRRVSGQRFILLVHHLAGLEPGLTESDSKNVYEQSLLPLFEGFIATSDYTAQVLRSYGLTSPVVVLQPPVVCEPHNDIRREFHPPVRALMACNLIPRKGVLAFLKALAANADDDDSFSLDIVGRLDLDPTYSTRCQQILATNPQLANRVRLCGPVPHHEMPKRFMTANVFLSASKMETFGISLQEARYYGLPILAVKGGNSHNHVSHGSTGELFADSVDLAQGLIRLIRQNQSSDRQNVLQSYFAEAQKNAFQETETWDELAARLERTWTEWFSGT